MTATKKLVTFTEHSSCGAGSSEPRFFFGQASWISPSLAKIAIILPVSCSFCSWEARDAAGWLEVELVCWSVEKQERQVLLRVPLHRLSLYLEMFSQSYHSLSFKDDYLKWNFAADHPCHLANHLFFLPRRLSPAWRLGLLVSSFFLCGLLTSDQGSSLLRLEVWWPQRVAMMMMTKVFCLNMNPTQS